MAWRLSAYYFAYFAFVGITAPYFGLYLHSLNFSAWEISLLLSQMQLMRLFGPYLWGTLVDRGTSRIQVIRWTAFGSLLGFSVYFFSESFTPLLAGTAFLAFFWNANLPLVEALTFAHLKNQASDYGKIRMWGSIGFIAMVLGLGKLLDHLPVSSILWSSAITLLAMLLLTFSIPNRPSASSHPKKPSEGFSTILKRHDVRSMLLASFLMSAAHGPLYVFYSIHLMEHGYSKSLTGLLWSLGVVVEIMVFMWMPRLAKHFGYRLILLSCFAAAFIRFLMIGWYADALWIIVAAQTLHGLTFGAHHASAMATINTWFSGNTQGRGQAVYSTLFGAGGLLGSLMAGACWTTLGSEWTYTLSSLLGLLGFFTIYIYYKDFIIKEL